MGENEAKVIDLLADVPQNMMGLFSGMKRYACDSCSCYVELNEEKCPFCDRILIWKEVK